MFPSSDSSGGNGCKGDCTDPTIGLDYNERRLVDNGFTYNDNTVNAIDFHTPFPLISTQIGKTNTVTVKAYDNIGPHGIRLVQFGLGAPEINSPLNNAEVIIEVWTTYSGIDVEQIVITDPYNLIENSSVVAHTDIVDCRENNSVDQKCIQVTMQYVYREAPIYNTMLVDVMDINRRVQTTAFNDGVEVLGESMNSADTMHVGFASNQITHPEKSGAIDLTQTDRVQKLWVDSYGYVWQGDESKMTLISDIPFERFEDSVSKFHEYNDRQNSNFAHYKQLQIEKARETFDKLVFYKQIQNDDLTDYVAHTIDYTITKRADSPILQKAIQDEKIRATELLEQILAKTHRIHMMED